MPRYDMVDVSNNNGLMTVANYKSMKARGVKAIVQKLSEGVSYRDPYAVANIQNAKKAGLHVNGYHFARFTSVAGAKAEAQLAVSQAKRAGLTADNVIVNDFESNNLGWATNSAITKAFADEVYRLGYPKTDIYTMGSWVNSMPLNNDGRAGWIANYPYNPSGMNLYSAYNAWQWTEKAHFAGCYGGFDVSQLYGDFYLGGKAKGHAKPKPAKYFDWKPDTVFAKTNVSRYTDKALKHKVDTFPAGTVFDVVELVKYGKTSRFKLANGMYISGNQNYINNLYYTTNSKVRVVKSVKGTNKYSDLDFKHKVKGFKTGTEFDVEKVVKHGKITRLQLADGTYISANKLINKFVE
ncbi:GH25 family lysozyme [Lentilactobacillus sp. SPB1-3]|uniref:GH25 family lysozyme n=1 Tax=Lentilactobacillus terminaliae TaxID=3003483 RepID=A0ACD5DCI1_9LACO|nr:GH25 family lysozyme [Lentilactobacillus sp. SPB1-3]MCZ0978112.1 GH25 family lysozyme [Lentilactobacillus sp. SPB1-3]